MIQSVSRELKVKGITVPKQCVSHTNHYGVPANRVLKRKMNCEHTDWRSPLTTAGTIKSEGFLVHAPRIFETVPRGRIYHTMLFFFVTVRAFLDVIINACPSAELPWYKASGSIAYPKSLPVFLKMIGQMDGDLHL